MRQGEQAAPGTAFRLTPAVEHAVAHRGWSMARDEIAAALHEGPCIVALLGEAGTGKTLLLAETARRLKQDGWPARLHARGDEPLDPSGGDILLVDEAARMSDAALGDIVRSPGVRIVLAELPGFADRLEALSAPVRIVPLEPMTEGEVHAFVAAQLDRAGCPRDAFEPDAVGSLARQSGGIPRVLNQLGRAAMHLASTAGRAKVAAADIEEAVALREGSGVGVPLPGATIVPGAAIPPAGSPVLKPRVEPSEGASVVTGAPVASFPERLVPAPAVPPPSRLRRAAVPVATAIIVLAGIAVGRWMSWPSAPVLPRQITAVIARLAGTGARDLPPGAVAPAKTVAPVATPPAPARWPGPP